MHVITYLMESARSDWLIHTIHLPMGIMLMSLSLFYQQFQYVVFMICYKRNIKCTVAYIKLWKHLGGLLSTPEARVPRGVTLLLCLANSCMHPYSHVTRCMHAACLPFLKSKLLTHIITLLNSSLLKRMH